MGKAGMPACHDMFGKACREPDRTAQGRLDL
jgi:hypothetical protein